MLAPLDYDAFLRWPAVSSGQGWDACTAHIVFRPTALPSSPWLGKAVDGDVSPAAQNTRKGLNADPRWVRGKQPPHGVLVPQAAGPTTTPTKFSRAAARRDVAPRWSGRLFPASTMRVRWRCISGGRVSGHALPQKRQMAATHLADNVQDDARARGAGISGQRSRPSCIRGGENV